MRNFKNNSTIGQTTKTLSSRTGSSQTGIIPHTTTSSSKRLNTTTSRFSDSDSVLERKKGAVSHNAHKGKNFHKSSGVLITTKANSSISPIKLRSQIPPRSPHKRVKEQNEDEVIEGFNSSRSLNQQSSSS